MSTFAERVKGPLPALLRGIEAPPSTNLLFIGPSGSGKTSLAVAMLDAWVRVAPKERARAMYVEAAWLSRARARHRLGEESPLVEACISAPLLVLDDLGSEREDRDGCITDVVYRRHNDDRPIWITCGMAKDPTLEAFGELLARRYDGGFVRRVLESGKVVRLGAKP
jgi:DNA replication protein DnaC